MSQSKSIGLQEKLAEIGGQLQKLRWEALDQGDAELARNIALAVDAIAWAAGVYAPDNNVVEQPKLTTKAHPERCKDQATAKNATAIVPQDQADTAAPGKPCEAA